MKAFEKLNIAVAGTGLAAVSSSFFAALYSAFGRYDVVHIHAEGPAFFCWIPKLFGKRVISTIHGLDWAREKWKFGVGSKFIRQGEKNAVKYADEIIVLSKGVQKYFMETYGRETHFIPNGVNRPEVREAKLITDHFGLEKDSYILFLGRLVPEKGIRYLVEAFKNVKRYLKETLIDIETYSEVDIGKCGLYRYATDPSFEILLVAWATDEGDGFGETRCADLASGEPLPEELLEDFQSGNVRLIAHNASFERVCFSVHLQRHLPGQYLKPGEFLSPDSWICTMVMSASLTLPMALKDVGAVLKTSQQKDKEGERLIKLFSMPCKPTKSNGMRTRNLPEHYPADWEKFKYYCIQDVNTEVDIYKRLKKFPMPEQEWKHYRVNERINDRGVKIDTELVQQAIACDLMLSDAMSKKAYSLLHEQAGVPSGDMDPLNTITQTHETRSDPGLNFLGGIDMGYTNSPLVVYTKLSPNHSGQRTHSIDRITPHCVVGQLSAESICGCFTSPTRQASCNYGIGTDGRVSLCVEEKNRSWCSSSNSNDQRAVTIECASDMTEPYAMNSAVYGSLIKLCIDICKRNGKKKLLWLGDKNKTLNYAPAEDEMILTVHRWFANKSCPGNWLYARLGDLAARVTAALGGSASSGLQVSSLKNLSEAEAVAKIGPLFTENQKQSGILACVSMAQFILESGYGKSELAQNANNCFGMKTSLSGNSWSGSSWDGKSVYTKKTQEQNANGSYVTITADFRKYACVEDSIADHAAYLRGAMNGSRKRYEGLAGCMDYKKAVQIIKDGGYATSHTYVQNLCNIIERWNLTQYNAVAQNQGGNISGWYRVRKSWQNAASQKGAFHDLSYAKQCADANPGYTVFDPTGKAVYPVNQTASVPYAVRVSINDLNIRKGPGTNYGKTGYYTGRGVFTIVAESAGAGSVKGWGKLKSGAGWIALDFAARI